MSGLIGKVGLQQLHSQKLQHFFHSFRMVARRRIYKFIWCQRGVKTRRQPPRENFLIISRPALKEALLMKSLI